MDNIVYICNRTLADNYQTANAKRILNQVAFLDKRNSVLVISFSPRKSNYKFNINYRTEDKKGILLLFKLPFYWLSICKILMKRKTRIDENYLMLESVVELQTTLPLIFAKMLGYKIIHDIVEDVFLQSEMGLRRKINSYVRIYFNRHFKRYCSAVIVISEQLYKKYARYNLPIIKLYNSVKQRDYVPCSLTTGQFTCFYSGTFGDVEDLINAFKMVSQKKKNIILKLIGRGEGEEYQRCLKLIRDDSTIIHYGYIRETEMFDQLKQSNLLCLARKDLEYENNGFPFKLAEYLSFGIPVLTTSVSDIPLLFTDRKDIYLAEAGNVTSIANSILSIVEDYDEAIKIGIEGKRFCEEHFSIDVIGKKLNDFIEDLSVSGKMSAMNIGIN